MVTLNEIEAWRVTHRLSKKELAKQLGLTYTYLVGMLNGKRVLSAATAMKFRQLSGKAANRCNYDDVRAFAIRMTEEEYLNLCRLCGVADLSPNEAEKAVRDLLQATWDELAATVPQVVDDPPEED